MSQRGFSLIEVLVALGIFAAVSAVGVGALNIAANGSRQLQQANERIAEMDRFRGLLRGDLYQLSQRSVYEAEATRPRPPFIGGDALNPFVDDRDFEPLFALVREGWANPGAEEPRAELQAVLYLEKDGAIIRRTRPFLDAVRDTPFRDDVLMEGVSDVEVSFRLAGDWRDRSPPLGAEGDVLTPDALQFVFTHPIYGEMRHVVLIGGGAL